MHSSVSPHMQEQQRLASELVGRVLAGRSLDAELATLRQTHPTLPAAQRAAVQDIAFGTLRFLGKLDAWIEVLLERPLRDSRLRGLLRVALYQLEYTKAAPHAVVDQAVRACGRMGLRAAAGLVNAVLRSFLRRREQLAEDSVREDVARYSHPQWWIDKLRMQYPDNYADILEAGNRHPPLALRVNQRRSTPQQYVARLADAGISARRVGDAAVVLERPRPVQQIPGFAEGIVSVQDAAAQQAAPLLDLGPGMRVLDACAAPGGKTAHMLELADVDLTALDSDATRLERLLSNLSRLGLTARTAVGDAGQPDGWWDGRLFDRILADVPCSASGVVRRHPDIKWLRRPADIPRFERGQERMLDALWQLLGSDGKLLYATCSVFHEENHLQVVRFLDTHGDARRLTPAGGYADKQQPPGQMLPDELHDGFFYALLQKT